MKDSVYNDTKSHYKAQPHNGSYNFRDVSYVNGTEHRVKEEKIYVKIFYNFKNLIKFIK